MPKLNYICTWVYVEDKDEQGIYPQLGMAPNKKAAHDVYWRCMVVFFETARRSMADLKHTRLLLFTNAQAIPTVDGIDIAAYLARLDVQIVVAPYTWKPTGQRRLWFNQYYLFDILSYLSTIMGDEDIAVVADCDCVFVRDASPLFETIRRFGVLLITVDESPLYDEKINGLSRREAEHVYELLADVRPQAPPPYFGGECYGVTTETLTRLLPLAYGAKPKNDALAKQGALYLSDEAHFFSFLMWKLGFLHPNGNSHVRRIWTSWKSNTTQAEDLNLILWHLPSEKQIGFQKVYNRLSAWPQSWSTAQNLQWLAAEMGVGDKSIRKFAAHLMRAVKRHLMPGS